MAKNKRVPDFMLETFLESGGGIGLSITLFVKGVVITGNITKVSDFYRKAVVEQLDVDGSVGLEDFAKELAEEEAEYKRISDLPDEERTEDQRKAVAAPHNFINLTDAHYQIGDGSLVPGGEKGLNVRVRAEAVDAWVLGRMSVERRAG
ncbi:MAG: hypothetical protein QM779_13925 [Propionicimonas sp.]|uniref:hypothetical protein n=1 Tax=Propionicimonas sp. TaxID=1955623 RepID=UPI003D0A833D